MDNQPVVTKIAFAVDERGEFGEEIRFVSMKLDDGLWTTPISGKSGRDGEYWRKVFLLFALLHERLDKHGPSDQWPRKDGQPILIHKEEDGVDHYAYWFFLVKAWHEKVGTIGTGQRKSNEPKTTRKKEERVQQYALNRLFDPGGAHGPAPYITMGGNLPLNAILLYPPQRRKEPTSLELSAAIPQGPFEGYCVADDAEVAPLFRELSKRVGQFERREAYRRQEKSWMGAYRGALASLVPEVPLHLTLQETADLQETGEEIDPRTERVTTVAPSPIVPRELILGPDPRPQQMLITGPSGAGKSTVLRQLANDYFHYYERQSPTGLPIYAILNRFRLDRPIDDLIVDSISRIVIDAGIALTADFETKLRDWLGSKRSRGPGIIFLLDGYNEIPFEHRSCAHGFDERLAEFLSGREGRVIIATRDELHPPGLNPQIYFLQPPDNEAIQQFVDAKLGNVRYAPFTTQILHDPRYWSLTNYPFFLDSLVELARQYGEEEETATTELPRSRSALLDAIVDRSIRRKFEDERLRYPGKSPLSTPYVMSVLAEIAHAILEDPARRVRFPDGIAHIVPNPTDRDAVIGTAVLAGLLEHINLDSTSVDQSIAFSHDLLRDYFAARHIKRRFEPGGIDLKREYLEYHRWDEPLCLFAEMCDNGRTFDRLLEDVAQEDFVLATELALRATHCVGQSNIPLIRGHAYWSEYAHELTATVVNSPRFLGPFPPAFSISTSRLLLSLDDQQLLRARREVPKASWLWCNVIAATATRGLYTREQELRDPPRRDYNETYVALEGLFTRGSADALTEVASVLRCVAPEFERHAESLTPDQVLFRRKCSRLFHRWPHNVPPERHLEIIVGSTGFVRWVLLHTLQNACFHPKHFGALLHVAFGGLDEASSALAAIGRVGGALAVDAILRFTEHLVRAHGDVPVSKTIASSLDDILSALAVTGEWHLAASGLAELLSNPHELANPRETQSHTATSDADGKLAWNRMLLDLVPVTKDPRFLFRHMVPEAVNEEIGNELKVLANTHPDFPVRHEARWITAKSICSLCPQYLIVEIEELLDRRPESVRDFPEYIGIHPRLLEYLAVKEADSRDYLGMWGLAYLGAVTRCIGSHAHMDTVESCAGFFFNENLPPSPRISAFKLMLEYGLRPKLEFMIDLLLGTNVFDDLLSDNIEKSVLYRSLHDGEAMAIMRAMKEVDLRSDKRYGSFGFGRKARLLMKGRERRYLLELESWPDGLRLVPADYRPAGYDGLVKMFSE